MAGTADVLCTLTPVRGTAYPVLVPNAVGLDALLALLREHPHLKEYVDEVAVFTAASDAFSARTRTRPSRSRSRASRPSRRARRRRASACAGTSASSSTARTPAAWRP
jgi:hypothetical protein